MFIIGLAFFSCASSSPAPQKAGNGLCEYSETMSFELLNERGMVLKREYYFYTGGAHGIGAVKYYVLDLEGSRVLKFDELFREDTQERLQGIVMDGLRRYTNSLDGYGIGEGEPLSQGIFYTDNPGLTDNFFVGKEGLGLNWAVYDIAPYFAGSIEIIVPWRDIRPLLQNEFMELLEKFGIPMFM